MPTPAALHHRLSIHINTKGSPPIRGLPFVALKEAVLGSSYELSLVFVGDRRSRTLNRTCRGKDIPANVLSFPLDAEHGEIIIGVPQARRDARRFGFTSDRAFIGFLFIHGLLHLSGMQHSSKMEKKERELCKQFRIA